MDPISFTRGDSINLFVSYLSDNMLILSKLFTQERQAIASAEFINYDLFI